MKSAAQRLKHDIQHAVQRLVKAEIADSWKGGGDPADIPAIERELVQARTRYRNVMARFDLVFNNATSKAPT